MRKLLSCGFAALLIAGLASPVHARVRLDNICTVQGQQEIKLQGLGLVIGLPGTGDGAKNIKTVEALRIALSRLNQPTTDAQLKNADNVALVMVEATIPRDGMKRGQKIDGYVSSVLGAKSLRGGRLLSTPLTALDNKKNAVALASGALTIEDAKLPTTGRLSLGVDALTNVRAMFVNDEKEQHITLLIDPVKASFWTSSEVANVINTEFTFEAKGNKIARAVSPGVVEVTIPESYQKVPVEFVAQVLEVGIDNPHTQARVVLNNSSKTVYVTGEVEISPVLISHKNYTIEVGADPEEIPSKFFAVGEGQNRQSPVQLQQLQTAMKQLRVPNEDIIAIIRDLHKTGKLHAELIDK